MAELFGCSTDNISLHLKNVFNEAELNETSVTEDSSVTEFLLTSTEWLVYIYLIVRSLSGQLSQSIAKFSDGKRPYYS